MRLLIIGLQIMDNCTIDCIEIVGNFTASAACNYAQNYCVQDTLQIVQGYYCLIHQSFILLLLAVFLFLTLLYYAINIVIEDYLTPCLQEFIVKLNISEALAGITFLALANGASDIITAIVAGTSSSGSTSLLPFGSLFGAALFCMSMVLAKVIQLSPGGKLVLNVKEVLVPLGFFIAGTVFLVVVSLAYGEMNLIVAFSFLGLYPLYIVFVIYSERKKAELKRRQLQSLLTNENSTRLVLTNEQIGEKEQGQQKIDQVLKDTQAEEEQEDEKDQRKPGRLFFHQVKVLWRFLFTYTLPLYLKDRWVGQQMYPALLLSPLVLCLAKGIPQAFERGAGSVPFAAWYSLPSMLLLGYSLFCKLRGRRPSLSLVLNFYSFVVSVSWLAVVAGVLINLMELLQLLTNINSVFLGLTVFAWANSVPDYLSITALVRRGYTSTAISGIFSAQLLNFLIGFGASCVLNSLDGSYAFRLFDLGDNTFQELSALVVLFVVGLALVHMVSLFVVVLRNRGEIGSRAMRFSRIYYVVFVGVALLMSISSDFFREYACDVIL